MDAFGWIGQLVEWLGRLIPRILIVRATHAGVKFVYGSRIKRIGPGIHTYWPVVTELSILPTARQTHNLVSQVMLTRDKQPVVLSGVVIYTITDVVKAVSKNWDISDTISDITMVAIMSVISSMTLDELISKIPEDELTAATRMRLRRFGVKVNKCTLTDFSMCRVIRLVGDGGGTTLPLAAEQR